VIVLWLQGRPSHAQFRHQLNTNNKNQEEEEEEEEEEEKEEKEDIYHVQAMPHNHCRPTTLQDIAPISNNSEEEEEEEEEEEQEEEEEYRLKDIITQFTFLTAFVQISQLCGQQRSIVLRH